MFPRRLPVSQTSCIFQAETVCFKKIAAVPHVGNEYAFNLSETLLTDKQVFCNERQGLKVEYRLNFRKDAARFT